MKALRNIYKFFDLDSSDEYFVFCTKWSALQAPLLNLCVKRQAEYGIRFKIS